MNLPYQVIWDNGSKLQLLYTADGTKLQKVASRNTITLSKKDYLEELEYQSDTLEAIYHAEGRVIPENGSFTYQYRIADHLGNTRVVFENNGSDVAQIVSQSAYYPYGLTIDELSESAKSPSYEYGYNNKELQSDFNLGWNYFSARYQNPTTLKFTTIDPLSSMFYGHSQYAYGLNNPITMIDPNGMASVYNWSRRRYEDEYGNEVSWNSVKDEYGIDNTKNTSYQNEQKTFTTYLLNDTADKEEWQRPIKKSLTTNEMLIISQHITSIYEDNGIGAEVFNYRFLTAKEGLLLNRSIEKNELFLAFINVKNNAKYRQLNASSLTPSGRVLIRQGSTWKSFVNIAGESTLNRSKMLEEIGYIAAHEILHQLLGNKYFGHSNKDVNLNTSGHRVDFERYHRDTNYKDLARRLLPKHRFHIDKILFNY